MESLRPDSPSDGADLRSVVLAVRSTAGALLRHFRGLMREGSAFVFADRVGTGGVKPNAVEVDSHFTVSGNEATALHAGIVNDGAGEVAFVLNRRGGVVNRWILRMALGSGRLTVSSTILGDVLQLARQTLATDSTALVVLSDHGGVVALRQVVVGAADSGGVGYRSLRVAN